MICFNCGAELNDGSRFCKFCGTKQPEAFVQGQAPSDETVAVYMAKPQVPEQPVYTPAPEQQPRPQVQPQPRPQPQQPQQSQQQPKAKSHTGLIIVIVILVIALLAGGGWFLFSKLASGDDDDDSSKGSKKDSSSVSSQDSDEDDDDDDSSEEETTTTAATTAETTTTTTTSATTAPPETTTTSEQEPAEIDYTDYGIYTFNGHYYKAFRNDEKLNFYSCQTKCNEMGGTLVSIASEEEQQFVMSILGSKPNYWIGLIRNGDSWRWLDGTPFSYSNWDMFVNDNGEESWQPDNYEENEDVVRLSAVDQEFEYWRCNRGGWLDTAKDGDSDAPLDSIGFICEWTSEPDLSKIQ